MVKTSVFTGVFAKYIPDIDQFAITGGDGGYTTRTPSKKPLFIGVFEFCATFCATFLKNIGFFNHKKRPLLFGNGLKLIQECKGSHPFCYIAISVFIFMIGWFNFGIATAALFAFPIQFLFARSDHRRYSPSGISTVNEPLSKLGSLSFHFFDAVSVDIVTEQSYL